MIDQEGIPVFLETKENEPFLIFKQYRSTFQDKVLIGIEFSHDKFDISNKYQYYLYFMLKYGE